MQSIFFLGGRVSKKMLLFPIEKSQVTCMHSSLIIYHSIKTLKSLKPYKTFLKSIVAVCFIIASNTCWNTKNSVNFWKKFMILEPFLHSLIIWIIIVILVSVATTCWELFLKGILQYDSIPSMTSFIKDKLLIHW